MRLKWVDGKKMRTYVGGILVNVERTASKLKPLQEHEIRYVVTKGRAKMSEMADDIELFEYVQKLLGDILRIMRLGTENWDNKYAPPAVILNYALSQFTKEFDTEGLKRLYRKENKIYVEAKDGQNIFLGETKDTAQAKKYVRHIGQVMRLFKPEVEIKNSAAIVDLCADIGAGLREMVKNAEH